MPQAPEATPGAFAEVLRYATEDALERIRVDAGRFGDDEDAGAFFDYLEHHLFDTDLDVHVWRRRSGVSRATYDRAVAELGPLKAYIDELRIAVASRLVAETDAVFSDIGGRVGFDVQKTFRRTFKRIRGQTPGELRSAHLAATPEAATADATPPPSTATPPRTEAAPKPAAPEPVEPDPSEDAAPAQDLDVSLRVRAARWRRRISLGLYDRGQVSELRHLLRQQYPGLEKEETPNRPGDEPPLPPWVRRPIRFLSTDDKLGWFAALTVVGRLVNLPDDEMRHAVVHGIRFGQLSGFYLLHEVSLKLFSHDAGKALKLAELTVETAEAHPEKKADDKADWRSLAWTCLGCVRMWAGDRAGADAAFVFARAEWETPRDTTLPVVEVRLHRHEAALRKIQRRYDEAVRLADYAIRVCHESGLDDALRFDCYLERAELAHLTGDPATAIEILDGFVSSPDTADLLGRRKAEQENDLRCVLHLLLGKAYAAAGEHDEARACFREARAASPKPGSGNRPDSEIKFHHWHAELDQAESRLCLRTGDLEQAESLMRAAVEGFDRLKVVIRRGVVTAELAGVCAFLGQREEARALGEKGVKFLEWLPLHREARRAARLLRALPEAEAVRLEDVHELCRYLDLVCLEGPSTPFRWDTLPEEFQS